MDYNVHDLNDPNQHVWMVVTPCGTNTPSPPNPLSCPIGQHYHDVTDSCHQDHQVPVCDRTNWLFYYEHDVDDHNIQLVVPCPNGPPNTTTTTTTTTLPPTTTTQPQQLTCGIIPQSELDAVKGDFGWESSFAGTSTVWAGTALPEGNNPGNLFVTSDKLGSAASAEPPIWPTYPTASSVTDDQGCVWDATTVRSGWRELHLWSSSDRAAIAAIDQTLVDRWNNLTTNQKDTIRTSHVHVSSAFPDCPVSTVDPENDCEFYLSHPAVYAWAFKVQYETYDGGVHETVWHTLHSGTSYLVRLIDYTDRQTTNTN